MSAAASSASDLPCMACLQACRHTSWHPAFRALKAALPAITVPIGPEFLEFLERDGIHLPAYPEDCGPMHPSDPRYRRGGSAASSGSSGSWAPPSNLDLRAEGPAGIMGPPADDDSDSEDEDAAAPGGVAYPAPALPALERALARALERFHGEVFVKLEWSAPRDAAWMNATGLKCTSSGQVFLLLGASDLVRYDIERAGADAPAMVHLVIMPWFTFHRSEEFRCFVRHRRLVGITQRHCTEHFAHLLPRREAVLCRLKSFIEDTVLPNFSLQSFAVDLYLDTQDRVWVIDFSPFGGDTDAGLFNWDELARDGPVCEHAADVVTASTTSAASPAHAPELRIVMDSSVRFGPHAVHAFPDDVVDRAAAAVADTQLNA